MSGAGASTSRPMRGWPRHEDAFGNITHVFTADGPLDELTVEVDGEVETQNTDGVVRGTVERFPPSLFLRDTALTQADSAIRDFAAKNSRRKRRRGARRAARLAGSSVRRHRLGQRDRRRRRRTSADNAAEAFARKQRRDCPRIWRISSSAPRTASAFRPAMSAAISADAGESADADTSHAWAEAYVPDLGWVGFDPSDGACPTDAHVRVAIGLDSLGAAAVRGTRHGRRRRDCGGRHQGRSVNAKNGRFADAPLPQADR